MLLVESLAGYDNAKFAQEELEKRNYDKVVETTLLL
jgi:hypothetical protein